MEGRKGSKEKKKKQEEENANEEITEREKKKRRNKNDYKHVDNGKTKWQNNYISETKIANDRILLKVRE